MANDHEPDVGQMWRQQPQSGHALSPKEIRTRAHDLDARVHKWRVVSGLTLALLLVKSVWEIWVDTDLLERAGDSMLAVGLLYVVYRFARRALAYAAPATLGLASCAGPPRPPLVRQPQLPRAGRQFNPPFA